MLQCSCGPRRWPHADPTSRSSLTEGEFQKLTFSLNAEYVTHPLVAAEFSLFSIGCPLCFEGDKFKVLRPGEVMAMKLSKCLRSVCKNTTLKKCKENKFMIFLVLINQVRKK